MSFRELYLEGQTKGIETISQFVSLEELTLRSITLPDLSLLLPLRGLRALELKLGGTKNLDLLPAIGELEYLEFWMIKGLSDVSVLSRMTDLRFVFLQALAQVTQLPSFAGSKALRRVHLETMKGLRDLTPIAEAPGLDSLLVIDCSQFRLEHLEPFVRHPALRSARIGTGSRKRNEAIATMLGLPDADQRVLARPLIATDGGSALVNARRWQLLGRRQRSGVLVRLPSWRRWARRRRVRTRSWSRVGASAAAPSPGLLRRRRPA